MFIIYIFLQLVALLLACLPSSSAYAPPAQQGRERIGINDGWRFSRSEHNPDGLLYDRRPDTINVTNPQILKPWILPSGNEFISDPSKRYTRPAGNPGGNLSYVQSNFNDSAWETVNLPHDWAIKGPFYTDANPVVGGGMGRLPVQGVGWYRRKLSVEPQDKGRTIYLDVDGAMSYAMVWLNGQLVGGWPYPYNSFRLDLTPYLRQGGDNQLAIRLDNPNDSARWYPGAGLYRNVWLTKVDTAHVGQWGTQVTTRDISNASATVDLVVQVENSANIARSVELITDLYEIDTSTGQQGKKVASYPPAAVTVAGRQLAVLNSSVMVQSPRLWGPAPQQVPNLYVAITLLRAKNKTIDTYETRFGIRAIQYTPNNGLLVNNQRIFVQGVNNHHDLGALGSAFNVRAAQRQLEILHSMGVNAIRTSHNPPAPELLDLTDRMGFLVLDEIFDSWYMNKTANDFHLIFPDWHEQDLRAMLRRDRNHASIVAWSYGNEVGEQQTGDAGAAVSQMLHDIVHSEDYTRLATASENSALPSQPFPRVLDIISLNYQGAGIRDSGPYAGLTGISLPPQYPVYHSTFPNKMIWSSETSATYSTRGTYLFPVIPLLSAPENSTSGGDDADLQVSADELYTAGFGSSPDKVFASQDANPYVAGEFVWSGFDYIGEPSPYYQARSSYYGIVDLAGFPKDRYYLYQSRWRPELKFAHILPHWDWPERVGLVTPVHVFSSADTAELFVNGVSQGRRMKNNGTEQYRFRWDQVVYQPGEVRVETYKNGSPWATETVRTPGAAAALRITADRDAIAADGLDLSYLTVDVVDGQGNAVEKANQTISFSTLGLGEIVATDNGDPADFTVFPSLERSLFSGKALAIVRALRAGPGSVVVTADAEGLEGAKIEVKLT